MKCPICAGNLFRILEDLQGVEFICANEDWVGQIKVTAAIHGFRKFCPCEFCTAQSSLHSLARKR